jgi:hypothetical protein
MKLLVVHSLAQQLALITLISTQAKQWNVHYLLEPKLEGPDCSYFDNLHNNLPTIQMVGMRK